MTGCEPKTAIKIKSLYIKKKKKASLDLNEAALLTNSAEEDMNSQNARICDWTAEGPLTPPRQTEAVSSADDKRDS